MKLKSFICLGFGLLAGLFSSLSFAADFILTINNKTNDSFFIVSTPGAQRHGVLHPKESGRQIALNFMGSIKKFTVLLYSSNTGNRASVIYHSAEDFERLYCNPQTPFYHCQFSAIEPHAATLDLSR